MLWMEQLQNVHVAGWQIADAVPCSGWCANRQCCVTVILSVAKQLLAIVTTVQPSHKSHPMDNTTRVVTIDVVHEFFVS